MKVERSTAQTAALPAAALGADRVPRPAHRATGDRDHPPGQPRVPGDGRHGPRRRRAARVAYPDTLVGTDSHTTMVNGLGVLGYGVGGIEAEAVLLGQPLYQPMPRIVGVRLTGELPTASTATDLVLVITEMLRSFGVVGCVRRVRGDGLAGLSLADRATISNMRPSSGDRDAVPDRRRDARVPAPDRAAGGPATSSRRYAKARACGASPATGPEFDVAARARPRDRRARRSPDRATRRTASRWRASANFRGAYPQRPWRPRATRSPVPATRRRSGTGRWRSRPSRRAPKPPTRP